MSKAPSPSSLSTEGDEDEIGLDVVYDDDSLLRKELKSGSPPSVESSIAVSTRPLKPLPLQKRRRVTRACDECRRKKIKCDGKQPCTHCTVYSYDCTYDQPSNRRRNPAPQYIEALENRLRRAEILLRAVLPDVDLDDANFDAGMPQRVPVAAKGEVSLKGAPNRSDLLLGRPYRATETNKESLLESMVENTGSLDLDDQGHWDFHGHSSGLVFLRRMREQFGDLVDQPESSGLPILKTRSLSLALESPSKSYGNSPADFNYPNTHDLPSKECAQRLCEYALNDACAIFPFFHKPTFYSTLDRVYDALPEIVGKEESRFLPLLYATMALGCLFAKAEQSQLQIKGYEGAIDQGFQWFKASRQLMEITDCRDLTSLQALLFMIMFLQSSAGLSTCYSHIGIALRSAIRMGLHRSLPNDFDPIEREVRKRIFWVVRKMDTYVGALLGLPAMLSDDDIDQDMPLEVDDDFITSSRVLDMPPGRVSVMAAFNAHTRLARILAKTVKYVYPIKGLDHVQDKSSQSYVVNDAKIREIEQDLQEWKENLPMALRPGGEAPPELARIQQLIRMSYAHMQMFLYRPFLHYVSPNLQSKAIDQRSYACAAACVSVSRNIVHITGEMKKGGLLVGAYWFYMYTTFFAIMALVYFVLENPQGPTSKAILRDAYEGKETLAGLAKRSMAADRCSITLAGLFKQLPEKLRQAGVSSSLPRKRQATSKNPVTPRHLNQASLELSTESAYNSNNDSHPPQPDIPLTNDREQGKDGLVFEDPSALHDKAACCSDSGSIITDYGFHLLPSNGGELQTSNGPNFSSPTTDTQAYPGINHGFPGHGFTDLSAMMFPSADPFAYPNQLMPSLDNGRFIKRESCIGSTTYNANAEVTKGPCNKFDAPMFRLSPGIMMHGQQTGPLEHTTDSSLDDLGRGFGNNAVIMMNANDDSEIMHQHLGSSLIPETKLDHSFEEDWGSAWMNHGYGPQ